MTYPIIPNYLENKGYPSKQDRQIFAGLLGTRHGICNSTDLAVSASGLAITVNPGYAFVKGTTNSYQGTYFCPHEPSAIVVNVPSFASSGSRLDQLILRVYDKTETGLGTDIAQFEILTGNTSGAGVTLANRTGAVTLPASSLLIRDLLVGTSGTPTVGAPIDPTAGTLFSVAGAPPQYALGRPADYVPSVRVFQSGTTSIPSGGAGLAPFPFASERWDTENCHDTVTNNGRLMCKTPGVYYIGGNFQWQGGSGGDRTIYIRLNGSVTAIAVFSAPPSSSGLAIINLSTHYRLNYGDFVDIQATHGEPGAINIIAGNNYSPEFYMTWTAP